MVQTILHFSRWNAAECSLEPGNRSEKLPASRNRATIFHANMAGEPVVVARTGDGALKAFSNVSRQRAALIVDGPGHGLSLRCTWTHALDARLLSQPEFEA